MASLLLGRLCSKDSLRYPLLSCGFALNLVNYFLCIAINRSGAQPLGVYFAMAVSLGVADALFNTQIYATLSTLFGSQSEFIFANYRMFQAGASAVAFGYHDSFSFNAKTWITITFLLMSWCLLTFQQWRQRRVTTPVIVEHSSAQDLLLDVPSTE